MIEVNKIYTRSEIASELGLTPTRLDHIKTKLTQLGYEYQYSGRGDNFIIEITKIPHSSGLKDFAKKYLKITTNRVEDLAHFLHYLLLSPEEDKIPSRSVRSIEQHTYFYRETITKYIILLRCAGLLVYTGAPYYYATKTHKTKPDSNTNTYGRYYETKEIPYDAWKLSYDAYYIAYNEGMKKVLDDPDTIEEYVIMRANAAKASVLEGWWPCAKPSEGQFINKEWPQYKELLSLLAEYPYEPYDRMEIIDIDEEFKELIDKYERIELKLYYKGKFMIEEGLVNRITTQNFTTPDEMMAYIVENGLGKEIDRLVEIYNKDFERKSEERWKRALGFMEMEGN